MTIKEAIKEINPDKLYSLTEVVRSGLIPPIKSYPTAYRIVLEELAMPEKDRLIKADIIGEGHARTIRIEGKNLINYLQSK
jgi:hypothetical protein